MGLSDFIVSFLILITWPLSLFIWALLFKKLILDAERRPDGEVNND